MELRKIQEKEFHDSLRLDQFGQRWTPELEKEIESNPLWVNMKYYSVERRSREFVLQWLRENCRSSTVLDYCCGNGEDAVFAAQNGAKQVIGIDISDVSVANCAKRAAREGVEKTTRFEVMDAEALTFPNDSFDIVTEYGSLHHLDLKKAYSELARVLKPGGRAICNETLGHNPLIHAYRLLTPKLRTPWEVQHILRKADIELANQYFESVEIHLFHLCTLLAVPFRNFFFFNRLLSLLEGLDKILLNIPGIRWQAWQTVFILSGPKKRAQT